MDRYDLIVRELSALIGQTCHLWHELYCLGGEQVPFRLARQTHTANGQMYPASFIRSVRDRFTVLQKYIRKNTDVFFLPANTSL